MAQAKKRPAPNQSAQRKLELARIADRPSKHYCAACGNNIVLKDLQMVIASQPGGHRVKQPHHKQCFQFK